MGTVKLAVKLLIQDFKKSLFYCGSLLFSSAIIFVFFNMMANPIYGGDGSVQGSANTFASVLAIIVVIIAMVMVFFANSFYLMGKTKELALTTISGGNVLNLAGFLFVQNAIIMGIAIPVGIVIGYFVNPIINSIVYDAMGVTGNIWAIHNVGIIYTIVSIITEMIWVVLIDTGYAYRTELLELLQAEKTMKPKDDRSVKTPVIVYYILFLFPVFMILKNPPTQDLYLVVSFVGVFGITGIMKFSLPKIMAKIQSKYYIDKKHSLIALGNLNYSVKQSGSLIIMIVVAFSFLVCFMCGYIDQPNYLVMIVMAYGVLVFLMAVSIVYKIMIEASVRAKSFIHLQMIGYIRKDIKKIVRKELIGFCLVLILFPLVYVGPIFFKYVNAGLVDSAFALAIILAYVIVFIITTIIAYFVYTGLVIKRRNA